MRKKLMAANWKMYKTPDQTRDFFRDFLPYLLVHTGLRFAGAISYDCELKGIGPGPACRQTDERNGGQQERRQAHCSQL